MKKLMFVCILMAFNTISADAQFGDIINKAKKVVSGESSIEDETGSALKEALNIGVEKAVNQLSAEDGYFASPYKIFIPDDAQKVIDKVKMVPGFENVEKDLIEKMNQAAELAAKKATPIFINSIKQMTIKDASSILLGEDNAATQYLVKTTRPQLYNAFMPVIQSSLDEVNARTYWNSVVTTYNKIPFVKKMDPDLDDHVNNKGLDGLFSLIEEKEEGIRGDQNQRTSDLLKKVFAKQD